MIEIHNTLDVESLRRLDGLRGANLRRIFGVNLDVRLMSEDVSLETDKATVTLPPGINYDRRWLLWRGRIIHEGFELVTGIAEIILVETFKRPEKKAE